MGEIWPNKKSSLMDRYPKTDWMRIHGSGGAHGRLVTSNASVLTYEHVFNNGNDGKGEVMETWSVQK